MENIIDKKLIGVDLFLYAEKSDKVENTWIAYHPIDRKTILINGLDESYLSGLIKIHLNGETKSGKAYKGTIIDYSMKAEIKTVDDEVIFIFNDRFIAEYRHGDSIQDCVDKIKKVKHVCKDFNESLKTFLNQCSELDKDNIFIKKYYIESV